MSDLFLTDTPDGGDITIRNGQPLTTDGLATAVYLSLFTPETWQDAIRRAGERYDSRIPLIKNSRTVNNQTRLALIAAAENALEWITAAAGAQVEVDATIESADLIAIEVTVTGPEGSESTTYGVNWSATRGSLEVEEEKTSLTPEELQELLDALPQPEPEIQVDIWTAGTSHTGGVQQIEESPDGDTIYSADSNGNVVATEAATGSEKWVFTGFSDECFFAGISDSRVYATSPDGTLRCLDAADGSQVWGFGPPNGDNTVTIDQGKLLTDGSAVLVGDSLGFVRKISTADGTETASVDLGTGEQTFLPQLSDDGSAVYAKSGATFRSLATSDLSTNWTYTADAIESGYAGSTVFVSTVNFGSYESELVELDASTGTPINTFPLYDVFEWPLLTGRPGREFFVNPENSMAAGPGFDPMTGEISVFLAVNYQTGEIFRQGDHAFDYGEGSSVFLGLGNLNNSVISGQALASDADWTFNGWDAEVASVKLTHRGAVVTGGSDGRIKTINSQTGEGDPDPGDPDIAWIFEGYRESAAELLPAADVTYAVATYYDDDAGVSKFQIIQLDDVTGLENWRREYSGFNSISAGTSGVFLGDINGVVRYLDADDGSEIWSVTLSLMFGVSGMVIDSTKSTLYVMGHKDDPDPTISFYPVAVKVDAETGQIQSETVGATSGESWVYPVLSADGNNIYISAQGGSNDSILSYEISTDTTLAVYTLPVSEDSIADVAVDPAGDRLFLFVSSYETSTHSVEELDISTGNIGWTATGFSSQTQRVAISPDGARLYATIEPSGIREMNSNDGVQMSTIDLFSREDVNALAFGGSNDFLYHGNNWAPRAIIKSRVRN